MHLQYLQLIGINFGKIIWNLKIKIYVKSCTYTRVNLPVTIV